MKFILIQLAGYKRIMLKGINFIELKPNKIIQLILGTNGSGKSSLLSEITPLPSNSNDYIKEGHSLKIIEHRGNTYQLKSTFLNGQKHSFIKNDEELNPGFTVSVQKELVKQEFSITPEIHELMIGRVKFTSMTASDRRYWFNQLSDTNYSYAIGVYNRLREKLRDTTGAIKLNKNRLVTETNKVLSIDEQNVLRKEVEEAHEFLQHILEYRKPLDHKPEDLENEFKLLEYEILKTSKSLISKVNKTRTNTTFTGIDQLIETISDLQAKERVFKLSRDDCYTKLDKINQSISVVQQSGNQGIEELQNKVNDALNRQTGLLTKKQLFKELHKAPKEALKALETLKDALGSIFLEIAPNADKQFSKESNTQATENLYRLREDLENVKSKIDELETDKRHQESHKAGGSIECPNCKYMWINGFDNNKYDSILVNIEKLSDRKKAIESEIDKKLNFLEELKQYFALYKTYQNYVNNWPALNTFWIYIKANNLLLNNPTKLLYDLDIFEADLLLDSSYNDIDNEILELNRLIALVKQAETVDTNKLINEQKELENSIIYYDDQLKLLTNDIKLYIGYKKDIEDTDSLLNKIKELNGSFELNTKNIVETKRRSVLNTVIRNMQVSLAKKEEVLSEVKTQRAIIEDIQNNITLLEKDEISLKHLTNELSPVDGLIAEGMFGFIRLFIDQMNSFIKNIWTYQMEIQPCQLNTNGSVDLDYKFPIKVEGNDNPVVDVSKGSSGMIEIIDLAFKITAIKHLKLMDGPLFLDEFGAAFDAAHRTSGIEMMKNLIERDPFTQLFVVNHYDSIYGALTNAEVCVLCDSNIDIPKNTTYNQHVRIH